LMPSASSSKVRSSMAGDTSKSINTFIAAVLARPRIG
jgi:hypothetical protein